MSTEVVMPQMGESIAEGTITKWLKKVGDRVERDEPLFEISTDKVDAEIPSPAAGTLTEIKFKEGETVEVNAVVAVLDGGDGAQAGASAGGQVQASAPPAPAAQAAVSSLTPPPPPEQPPAPPVSAAATPAPPPPSAKPQASSQPPPATAAPAPPTPEVSEAAGRSYDDQRPGAKQQGQTATARDNGGAQSVEDLRRTKSSPLVRNIAKEHGIDISQLEGTGASGRVTKNDILSFIESGAPTAPQPSAPAQPAMQPGGTEAPPAARPTAPPMEAPAMPAPPPVQPAVHDRVEQMSVMRRRIADHMVMSRRTSAHFTTVY